MPEKRSKIIGGESFELSLPYEAGHVLNALEAIALNQVRCENIANNVRKRVTELIDADKLDEAKEVVANADEKYVFSPVGTVTRLDPVEREAIALARDAIKTHLAKDGRKINKAPDGFTEEEWEAKIDSEIARIAAVPSTIELARKRIAERAAVMDAAAQLS